MNIVLYGVSAEIAGKIAGKYGLKLISTPDKFQPSGTVVLVPPMGTPRQLLAFYNAMLRHEDDVDAVIVCGIESCEAASTVQYCTPPGKFFSLGGDLEPEELESELYVILDSLFAEGTIGISARNGDGIESLRRILRSFVDTEALYHGDAIVSNNRHYEALTAAGDALRRALDGLNNSLQTDLLSEEIRQVIHHVGSVTGRNSLASEEVLKHIFSKHCVGK